MDAHQVESIDVKDIRNYNLLAHNTFGIDARCRRYVEFSSSEEARRLVGEMLTAADTPLLILGGGSNLLLTGDYGGTVVSPEPRFEVEKVEQDDCSVVLRCWAGTTFDDVVAYCVEHDYHGAENLSLIPGEVGASAVQNIGAYGVEVKDFIVEVEAVEIATGKVVNFTNDECEYGYRQSKFKHEWRDKYLVTHVSYRFSKRFEPKLDYGNIRARLGELDIDMPTARQLRDVIIDIRQAKLPDPAVQGNAGSFFMNPIVSEEKFLALQAKYPQMPYYQVTETGEGMSAAYKIPAGWMIDRCGWKGKRLGPAGVHDKQALVLVNLGGARGEDILHLCNTIRKDVRARFGIEIYPEVNIR